MQRPASINYQRKSRILSLVFGTEEVRIPAELLRVYSPSAEVRGHADSERKLQTGKKYVGITEIEPVGNYAIRLVFDDGHDSGIYAWDYLYELGSRQEQRWQTYFAELREANASRLPAISVGQWNPKA